VKDVDGIWVNTPAVGSVVVTTFRETNKDVDGAAIDVAKKNVRNEKRVARYITNNERRINLQTQMQRNKRSMRNPQIHLNHKLGEATTLYQT